MHLDTKYLSNESISFDPAIKKRGPVSQFVDLDETQIQFD